MTQTQTEGATTRDGGRDAGRRTARMLLLLVHLQQLHNACSARL